MNLYLSPGNIDSFHPELDSCHEYFLRRSGLFDHALRGVGNRAAGLSIRPPPHCFKSRQCTFSGAKKPGLAPWRLSPQTAGSQSIKSNATALRYLYPPSNYWPISTRIAGVSREGGEETKMDATDLSILRVPVPCRFQLPAASSAKPRAR